MILRNSPRVTPFESPSWSLLVKPESKINRETRQFFTDTIDNTILVKKRSPKANLRLQYKKIYEVALVVALILMITTFQLAGQFSLAPTSLSKVDFKIEVADIPVTEQFRKPSPPPRPTIPIPTEEESIPEDLTIALTEIDLTNIPPPPPPPEDEELIFVAYDKPPEIIGGFAKLQKYLKYPMLAWKSGIEGIVFIKVTIGVDGRTECVEIIKAKPANCGFEESAVEAIKKVRWEPAKQRDKKIRVWVTIPVEFKLFGS